MNPRLTSDGPPGAPGWPAWPPTPDRTPLQRAPTNRNLARRATPGRLPAQPPLSGPHPAAQRGVLHH